MSELESSAPVLTPDPWTQLWGQTTRSTWDLMGEDPVALALREHWQAQSVWLNKRSHILDVGSGPAVLTRLLQAPEASRAMEPGTVRWTCVDQAHMDASATLDLPGVEGRFGVPWEALPLPLTGADALVSNFGLEYVTRDQLVRTCASWLTAGGRLHAILHARDSVIDQQSAQGLSDLDLILDELDFPGRVAALLEARVTAPADPLARMMHGVEVRDAFNESVNHMKTLLDQRGARQGILLEWLMLSRDLVQSVAKDTLETTLHRLQTMRAAYDAERARLTAMRSCALLQPELEVLGQELAHHGFEAIQLGSLVTTAAGQVGWVLDALKVQGSRAGSPSTD